MDQSLTDWYEKNEREARSVMHDIWEHPEYAMEEYYAAGRVAEFMKDQGFQVETFDARNPKEHTKHPNTVYAKFGSGKPVIAILGELDALQGLGNEAVPYRAPLEGNGHGCGHNLIAGCGAAAAGAVKAAMEAENLKGTLVFIGCPAEETLSGKVWLAKWGYFDDVELCLQWHPKSYELNFGWYKNMADTIVLFEFTGKAAHGVFAWDGRSALDACELMNIGTNYLREHMTEDCRVTYVYKDGGKMPNIVPEHASVLYYICSKDENNKALVERVEKIAKAAAMMTETEVKITYQTHCWGKYPTVALTKYVAEEAEKVPPLVYEKEEYAFARELHKSFFGDVIEEDSEELLPTRTCVPKDWEDIPFKPGSSDIGDISHMLPAYQLEGLGEMTGSPAHHWTITAAVGTSIGEKAAIYASKIIAQSVTDVYKKPELLKVFWDDFHARRQKDHLGPYQKWDFE